MKLSEIIITTIREYLCEQYILNNQSKPKFLNENISQAEKLLKTYGMPLDNPTYLKIKNELLKSNNIGYLGVIIKLTNGNLNTLSQIYEIIWDNKILLKNLPKNLQAYNNLSELRNDIETLKESILMKKLANKLTNDIIKDTLLNSGYKKEHEFKKNVEEFLKLNSSDQKEFLSKSDKYKYFESFTKDLKIFIEEIKIGFTYNIVNTKISSMNPDEIKILFSDKNKQMILSRILKYSASKMIGSQSWCIVSGEDAFNSYTKNGKNYQYFFFNFNENVKPNEKMIAFTMDEKNKITAAHDRYDNEFDNISNYLTKIGIKEKIYLINSRERKQNTLNKLGIFNDDTYYSDDDIYLLKVYDHNEMERNFYGDMVKKPYIKDVNYHKNLLNVSFLFLTELLKSKNHLDIIVKKFENYPVNLIIFSNERISTQTSINIIIQALNEIDYLIKKHQKLYDNSNITKEKIINVVEKIYKSGINIEQDTKRRIAYFLNNNGIDVLKISQLKNNKDLTDMEFVMLKNRGENLTPIIQNKLSAIRRGENVNLSVAEIDYAIDNGFKTIIEKYYKNMIPTFYDHQFSYNDMSIYNKLGLLNNVAKVIIKKGEYWGVDSLNSIERSVYDYYGTK